MLPSVTIQFKISLLCEDLAAVFRVHTFTLAEGKRRRRRYTWFEDLGRAIGNFAVPLMLVSDFRFPPLPAPPERDGTAAKSDNTWPTFRRKNTYFAETSLYERCKSTEFFVDFEKSSVSIHLQKSVATQPGMRPLKSDTK